MVTWPILNNKLKTQKMDIFDSKILCNKCGKPMVKGTIHRNGFNLRAWKCEKCKEIILHPADKAEYENFMRLKNKDFEVKMRMVGNSYAVSIPREIVDFMKEQERIMNNMVRLSFQDAGRLSLMFNTPENSSENSGNQGRIVKAREVKIVKNGKPVLHAKEFSDSSHPERNIKKVFKAKPEDFEEDIEE
jgi:ribosomal protein L37AE/L43A